MVIDGKTIRRSHQRKLGKCSIHMVSAFASERRLTLGQISTDKKSNEITAIPLLLDMLDVTGATITIDAMGCQTRIADKVIAKGGNYLLALKINRENLLA